MTLLVIAPGYLMACSASPCCLPLLVRGLELVELVLIFSCYGHPARGLFVEEICQILSGVHRPGRKSV